VPELAMGEIPRPATIAEGDLRREPTHRDLRSCFHRAFSYALLRCHEL
jgi:hypothetical protein